MKRYGILTIIFIGLVFLTYFFVLKDCDFNLLIHSLEIANPFYLGLALICTFLYVLFGSLFLKMILNKLNHKSKLTTCLGYMFTEIYFSSITPSYIGGQPIQMLEMKKDKIPYEKSSVVVLYNSMMNRISLMIIAVFLILLYHKTIFSLNKIYTILVLLGFGTTLLTIGLFALVIYSQKASNLTLRISKFFINHLKFIKNKEKIINNLKNILDNYRKCANMTKNNKSLLWITLVILLLQRIAILLTSYFVYISFGLNEYPLLLVLAFQICVTLGSDLMPTPGGVLVNESLLLVVNKLLYGSGLALSGMLLLRFLNFYLLVIISAVAYFIFHFRKSN